jgi:hypothetical protein
VHCGEMLLLMSVQGQNPKCSSTITRPLSPAADITPHCLWAAECQLETEQVQQNSLQKAPLDLLDHVVGSNKQGQR